MKIIYSVQNFISNKWIYDAIVSITSVNLHNSNSEFIIYYDTEETKELLNSYLSKIKINITYIKDTFSKDFQQKLTQPYLYLGNGTLNIFHALQNFTNFLFLDTDVFCYNTIKVESNSIIGMNCKESYTRSICFVKDIKDKATKLLNEKLPEIKEGCLFQDEIILNELFKDDISKLNFSGIVHLGNTRSLQKDNNCDLDLFNSLFNKLKNSETVSFMEYLNYIKGKK
jgi:hypothetical protein